MNVCAGRFCDANINLTKNLTFASTAPESSPVPSPMGGTAMFSFPSWTYDVFNASSDGAYPRAIYKLSANPSDPAVITVGFGLGIQLCSMVLSSYTTNGTVFISGTSVAVGVTPSVTSPVLPAFPQPLAVNFHNSWSAVGSINITTPGLRGPDLWGIQYI